MITPVSNTTYPLPVAMRASKREYIPLNMNLTNALLDNAYSNRCSLYTVAAKIACFVFLPFCMLAIFEALVLNSVRTLRNCFIALENGPRQPSASSCSTSYACTEIQKQIIFEIIETVATHSKTSLLFQKQAHLRKLQSDIQRVHPLKFLEIILRHPPSKRHLQAICKDPFKKMVLISDLGSGLTREMNRAALYPYLDSFASATRTSAQRLRSWIEARNWEGLLLYLLN